jgi:hypothetical protein
MAFKFSEKVLYDLKEHSFRHDFRLESLFPCRNRREREQLMVFMEGLEQIFVEETIAAGHNFFLYKSDKQRERSVRLATLERIGRTLASAHASKTDGTGSNNGDCDKKQHSK